MPYGLYYFKEMRANLQIFKEMNLISLGSFAFPVHVLIRKLQDLDRMPIKKCSTRNF